MVRNGGDRTAGEGTDGRTLANRRTVLKAAGAAGVFGLTGTAGCLSSTGGTTGTVNYGILNPLTGPYSALAQEQKRGAELGIKHVNESDEFDFTIEANYVDTQADPETGSQRAQELVQQNDADYLMGAISSSVAISINSVAADEEVIYNPGGAAIPITGSECNEYVFRCETNTAQIAEACAEWTLENLGSNVWFHIADYSYGNSVYDEWTSRMEAADAEFNEVGKTAAELGASNFDPFISDMKNSDADVVVVGSTGGDFVTFAKQAAAQGLKDQMEIMTSTGTFRTIRQALGADAAGIYSGTRYVPKIETGDNQEFVSAFQDDYDGEDPDNFARVAYDSIRMTAAGIAEAGSTDPTEVKDALPGLTSASVFGDNNFRDCDHQATNPVWVGQNQAPEGGGLPPVELIEKKEGEAAIPPCEETGCDMG